MATDPSDLGALSLSIGLTKPLERLLTRAAMDRDLTPEALAKRILSDWLLVEGGFKQERSPRQKARRDSADCAA